MIRSLLNTVLFASLSIIIFNNLGQLLALFSLPLSVGEATVLLADSAFFAGMFTAGRRLATANPL